MYHQLYTRTKFQGFTDGLHILKRQNHLIYDLQTDLLTCQQNTAAYLSLLITHIFS